MFRLTRGTARLVCALGMLALPALAQQNLPDGPKPKDQPQQSVPDAPQPKNPQNQFPENAPPAPKNAHPEPAATPAPTPATQGQRTAAQPGIITDVGKLGTISIAVNFVQVPVTVKDN